MSDAPISAAVVPAEKQGCLKIGAATCARLSIHFLVLVMIFAVLVGPVQTFMQHFEREDLKLPAISVLIVNASHRMNKHFPIIIPPLLFLDFVVLFGLQCLPRPWRVLARLWFSGVLFSAVMYLAMAMFAMALPIDATLGPDSHILPREEPDSIMIEAPNR